MNGNDYLKQLDTIKKEDPAFWHRIKPLLGQQKALTLLKRHAAYLKRQKIDLMMSGWRKRHKAC